MAEEGVSECKPRLHAQSEVQEQGNAEYFSSSSSFPEEPGFLFTILYTVRIYQNFRFLQTGMLLFNIHVS